VNAADLEKIFAETGALLNGHFKLSSGLHAKQYFQCALLLANPARASRLGKALAARLPKDWPRPDTVVGPALGGVVIGHETARALGVRSIFTERKEGRMELRRGFTVRPGEKIVIVEDVMTTGKSTAEVARLLRELGADIIGALAIVLRKARDPEIGLPVRSLARLPVESYPEDSCPLCAEGVPIVKPGSRPTLERK